MGTGEASSALEYGIQNIWHWSSKKQDKFVLKNVARKEGETLFGGWGENALLGE